MFPSLYLAALFALAPPAAPLPAHLNAIMQAPAFAHASFGLAVYDLDRKRMVYARNADSYFLAASTTKLLTEGATLALLGPRYRFVTNVYRTGSISAEGTLAGNIVLRASGDPNLSGRVQPDDTLTFENEDHSYDGTADTRAVAGDPLAVLREFAQQIAARGVRRVTGRAIVDDTLFNANFSEAGTGAVVSPIAINDNIIDVIVSPGAKAGEAITFTISPQTSYAHFINKAVTCVSGMPAGIVIQDGDTDEAGAETVTLKGCVAPGSARTLYAYDVPSPRRFAEMALTDALRAAGVSIAQSATDAPVPVSVAQSYTAANVVAAHRSAPLSEDVKVTLKVSDNLHADMMPYLWAGGDPLAGFARERAWLAAGGLDPLDVVQADGLGGGAFLQPAFMVRYLQFLRGQPFFADLQRALPVLGRDGTLSNIQTGSPAVGKVFAKTGTWRSRDLLNGRRMVTAKGLAGYLTTAHGSHLAFCFYVNNFAAPAGSDGAQAAGELLGALATAVYLHGP